MQNVFLFELDSVYANAKSITRAHRALYHEIVNNGNCVVLTFNQQIDSATEEWSGVYFGNLDLDESISVITMSKAQNDCMVAASFLSRFVIIGS